MHRSLFSKLNTGFVPPTHACRIISRQWNGRPLYSARPQRRAQSAIPFDRRLRVRGEMAGQYGETYGDISKHLTDLFTYKAVKTVLAQLQETDPTNYKWLYNFCVENKPSQSHSFCKLLVKEKRELGERILTTRVHLIQEWLKRLDKIDLVSYMRDKNLAVYRESLKDSVNFIFTAKPRPELGE